MNGYVEYLRRDVAKTVQEWFDQHADASDAGYSVVSHSDLPALVDALVSMVNENYRDKVI